MRSPEDPPRRTPCVGLGALVDNSLPLKTLTNGPLGFLSIERTNTPSRKVAICVRDHLPELLQAALTAFQSSHRLSKHFVFGFKFATGDLRLNALLDVRRKLVRHWMTLLRR
ncbi:MAG: hypothetical protein WD070_04545 [Pirellulaceae bacterium]